MDCTPIDCTLIIRYHCRNKNLIILVIGSLLGIAASFQGVFMSCVLLFSRKLDLQKRLLYSIFLLCFALWSLELSAYWTSFFIHNPDFIFLTRSLPWLLGPCIYLLAKSLSSTTYRISKLELIHFIPFIVRTAFFIPFYTLSRDHKINIFQNLIYSGESHYGSQFYVFECLFFLLLIGYIYASFRIIQKTSINDKTLINLILLAVGLFASKSLLQFSAGLFFNVHFLFHLGIFVLAIASLIIYSISYFLVIRTPESFFNTKQKYENNTLSDDIAKSIEKEIVKFVVEEENYLDSSISLKEISKNIGVSTNQISQVINSRMKLSFADYINIQRISKSKEMLIDPNFDHYSILAISQDSGFSNKATFYNAFKKHVGCTPKQYKTNKA